MAKQNQPALFFEDETLRSGSGMPARAQGRKSAAPSGPQGMGARESHTLRGIDRLTNRARKARKLLASLRARNS